MFRGAFHWGSKGLNIVFSHFQGASVQDHTTIPLQRTMVVLLMWSGKLIKGK